MSPDVRAQTRSALLAEVCATSPHSELDTAEVVTRGRDGLDDAPAPVKKRWFVVGAGLVAAAAAVAIVAGTGLA
ncbi:MAG: hypothetical protein WBG76_14530 [Ornithinimicrobium sp.]